VKVGDYTLCAQHRGLDGGQDLELGSNGGYSLTDLQQILKKLKISNNSSIQLPKQN